MGVTIVIHLKKSIKKYKKTLLLSILVLIFSILLIMNFPGIYFLIFMIIFDRLLLIIQKKNHMKLFLENVTITSLIMGQITSISIALFGTFVMFFINKIRDAKMGFDGLLKDAILWPLFAIISHSTSPENLFLVASVLIVFKFILDKAIAIIMGGSFEDIAIDFANMFYHIAFVKVFVMLFLL